MTTTLEARLRSLEIAVPLSLVPAALAAARREETKPPHRAFRKRTALAGLAVGSLVVGANVVAAEYVPAYREFAQSLPIIKDYTQDRVRQSAGIPENDLAPVGEAAGADEFIVTVIGTYADEYRTTVLVRVTRNPDVPPTTTTLHSVAGTSSRLVDSAGTVYRWREGTGLDDKDGWTSALDFEPLSGPAAAGEPLTLIITDLVGGLPGQNQGYSGTPTRYPGNWEFTLSIEQQEAPQLPVPPEPLVFGDTEFTITSIRLSGYKVLIEWEARGGATQRWVDFNLEHPQPWQEGPEADEDGWWLMLLGHKLGPWIIDSSGNWVSGASAGGGGFGGTDPCNCGVTDGVYRGSVNKPVPAPGEYTIKFWVGLDDIINFGDGPGWPITIPE